MSLGNLVPVVPLVSHSPLKKVPPRPERTTNMSKENCYSTTKKTQRPLKLPSLKRTAMKSMWSWVNPDTLQVPPGEGEGVDYAALDAKGEENWTEDERISTLGRPRLGDVTKIQIRIRESKEFKSSVDRMMQRGNASVMAGANSWKGQIFEAFTVQAGDDDEEEEEGEDGAEKEEKMPTCGDYIMHFLTLFWKVIFSFIPPAGIANGYPCFVVSIAMIGLCTA